MDLKLIRNLVRIMERGEVTELEIDDEKAGLKVHLKRGHNAPVAPGHSVVMMPGAGGPMQGGPMQGGPMQGAMSWGGSDDTEEEEVDTGRPAGVEEVTSPMVGTFYRAASPGADVFADVGTRVDEESVICIIEAMKVMNEIKAEVRGEVVEVLVENGEPVEFGQPLFLVKST